MASITTYIGLAFYQQTLSTLEKLVIAQTTVAIIDANQLE